MPQITFDPLPVLKEGEGLEENDNVAINIVPLLPLINQRGRRICSPEICVSSVYLCALYLSLSAVLFVAADPRYLGVDLHAHTLSLFLSLSLPYLAYLSSL